MADRLVADPKQYGLLADLVAEIESNYLTRPDLS
jgi:hypothetical protein